MTESSLVQAFVTITPESSLWQALDAATSEWTDMSTVTVESGSWTPVLEGNATAGSNTYATQSGTYVRIGDLVFVSFRIVLSALDGAAAGLARVGGLPYASASDGIGAGFSQNAARGITLDSGYTQIIGQVGIGESYISIGEVGSDLATGNVPITNFTSNAIIAFSGFYQKAA